MVHATTRQLLAAYDGLALPERDMVDRHVRICPECAALLALYRRMDTDLAGLADPRPPRGGAAMRRVALSESAAHARWRVAASDRARSLVAGLAPAFALALVTVGLLFALQSMPQRGLEIVATPSLTPTPTPSLGLATPLSPAGSPMETVALASASATRPIPPTASATLRPLATGPVLSPVAFRPPMP